MNMKGLYVIYTNVNRGGWHKALETPQRKQFEGALNHIFMFDEPISVITIYRTKKADYPLVSFHNKCLQKTFDYQKVYKLLPKD